MKKVLLLLLLIIATSSQIFTLEELGPDYQIILDSNSGPGCME